jgi:hypothetical protein
MLSQKVVLELLMELGGRATSKQISQLALERYPEDTLHTYVSNRLRKLANWGLVRHNSDDTWEVIPQEQNSKVFHPKMGPGGKRARSKKEIPSFHR